MLPLFTFKLLQLYNAIYDDGYTDGNIIVMFVDIGQIYVFH
jgi:hypothetical protein